MRAEAEGVVRWWFKLKIMILLVKSIVNYHTRGVAVVVDGAVQRRSELFLDSSTCGFIDAIILHATGL